MEQSLKALEFDKLREMLVNLAGSEESRELLSELSPSQSLKWVKEELKRVEEARGFIERGSSIGGGGLKDIRPLLKKIAVVGSSLIPEELLAVLHHLRVHHSTRRILDKDRNEMRLICRIARPLEPLPDLESRLESCLTPEGSIRDKASPELSRLRRSIVQQQSNLRDKLSKLLPKLTRDGVLREESFTIRDGRYVLPVRSDAFGRIKGIIHDRSSTGGTLFVEPTSLIDAGNELRHLELAERDEIRRILRELTDKARDHIDQIRENQQVMTEIDLLFVKANLAVKLDCIMPVITEEGPIRILGGRHPLLVLTGERKTVPLTLEMGIDWTTLVISGPNAGGKSVALKCVGLLCAMAGCGLHVPALPGTELPLYVDIQADIGDQQSIADDLSTFTAHLTRQKEILEKAGRRTLVLIDEIGAGTDPQEGSSLSISILERLTDLKTPTIVTTHHGTLKAFAHSPEGCANGSMEFDLKTFRPTFRFRPEIPGSSYALDIARRAGLPDELVERARELLGSDRSQLEDLIASLGNKLRQYETLVVDEKQRSDSQKTLEEAYQKKLAKIREREKELKKRTIEQGEELLRNARRTVEAVVKEIREEKASREVIKHAHEALDKLSEKLNGDSKLPEETEEKAEPIRKKRKVKPVKKPQVVPDKEPELGDTVRIDDSSTTGEITDVSSKGNRVCVAVGSVQLWVAKDRVMVVKQHKETPVQGVRMKGGVVVPKVPLDLDIRGCNSDEAIRNVDNYLYDGAAAGRDRLGIIHGKGAGILSRKVRSHLKNHPLVQSFRFGEYGEGDYGVTLVVLKK